jgi:hypothetical protein
MSLFQKFGFETAGLRLIEKSCPATSVFKQQPLKSSKRHQILSAHFAGPRLPLKYNTFRVLIPEAGACFKNSGFTDAGSSAGPG